MIKTKLAEIVEELKISISIIGFPHIGKFFTPWASSLCLLIITFSEISFLTFYKAWGHVFFTIFIFQIFFLLVGQSLGEIKSFLILSKWKVQRYRWLEPGKSANTSYYILWIQEYIIILQIYKFTNNFINYYNLYRCLLLPWHLKI